MLAGAWIGLGLLLAIAALALLLTGLVRRDAVRRDGGPIIVVRDDDEDDHHFHDHFGH